MEPAFMTLRCNVIGKVSLISNKVEVAFVYLVMMIMARIYLHTLTIVIISMV
jgi:hypothetical protein